MENLKLVSRECFLSFSRIYHRLYLDGDVITVVQFLPRVDQEQSSEVTEKHNYKYLFQVPDSDEYITSTTTFKYHNLDSLNWSLLDTQLQYRNVPRLFKDDMKCFATRYFQPALIFGPCYPTGQIWPETGQGRVQKVWCVSLRAIALMERAGSSITVPFWLH
uniref:Uncharacterized protein n=1 Tax=Ascaris lumbricoides TaxID=6252 RepID=A0A0M3HHR4_ASCLU